MPWLAKVKSPRRVDSVVIVSPSIDKLQISMPPQFVKEQFAGPGGSSADDETLAPV